MDESDPWPTTASGKPIVYFRDGPEEIGAASAPAYAALRATGRFFEDRRADTVVEIRDRGDGEGVSLIRHSGETLRVLLPNFVQFVVSSRTNEWFKLLNKDQGAVFLASSQRSSLLPIEGVVRTPSYDRELRLLRPGYNEGTALWFDGKEVSPSWELTSLRSVLADFPFRDDGSRSNLIGYLVSTLIYSVVGKGPLLVIAANFPGAGKTTLAKLIGLLVDGRIPASTTFSLEDESFEKALGAKLRNDGRTILIDNAKVRSNGASVSSAVLERFLTDDHLTTRLLGQSLDITRRNDVVWVLTLNAPRLSTDLADRALTVNLELEGNADKRTFQTPDLIAHARKQRLAVLADLVGMVERWKEAGTPSVTVEFGRFPEWAAIVAGILHANEIPDFLTNRRLALTEHDSELQDLLELGVSNINVALSPTEWLTKAKGLGVLGPIRERPTPRSQSTSMGLLLTRAVGRRLRDLESGRELVLVREEGEKNSLYKFTMQEPELVDGLASLCSSQPPGAAPARVAAQRSDASPFSRVEAPAPAPAPPAGPGPLQGPPIASHVFVRPTEGPAKVREGDVTGATAGSPALAETGPLEVERPLEGDEA